MITKQVNTFTRGVQTEYNLEPKDFDYLAKEFNAIEDSLGINLVSKKDPKLSILIRKYGVYYDRDVSSRRTMIATERVDVRIISMLSRIEERDWYQKYIPTSSEQLSNLVDEFKFKPMGSVKEEDILNFLSK